VPPRFLKKPQDKIELANKDIELECSVHGTPEPKISWFKDGEVITSNEYYQIVNGYYGKSLPPDLFEMNSFSGTI
jgi:neogenin